MLVLLIYAALRVLGRVLEKISLSPIDRKLTVAIFPVNPSRPQLSGGKQHTEFSDGFSRRLRDS